jgi:hypothetical protein
MNSFVGIFNETWDNYYQFLKEENRRKTMTPKEYGMMLQKKHRKKKRKQVRNERIYRKADW